MNERAQVEVIVVGAGVIGLALARRLAADGREVIVVEAEKSYGCHTSSRNSEVIHAGIYYPKDSLKARLCVRGKHQLYEYCAAHGVGHRRLGKLIVATTSAELPVLEELKAKAGNNGVEDLEFLNEAAAIRLEPQLRCAGALLSPSTGIVDSHGLMRSYLGQAEAKGALVSYGSRVEAIEPLSPGGYRVRTHDSEVDCQTLINAAGLGAQGVAAAIEGFEAKNIPRRYLTKGSYFSLAGAAPFSRLIYPVPNTASLGIHLTLDLGGRARFGPDQEWVDEVGYEVDAARGEAFYASVRSFYPALRDGSLQPDYAGVRPKVQAPGEGMADFVLQGPRAHGWPGLVNLFGMESPGLTASLAIADEVVALLEG